MVNFEERAAEFFHSLISSNNPVFHCYAKFVDTLLILIKVVVNSSSFQLGFKN
jgi:hypothetical protein